MGSFLALVYSPSIHFYSNLSAAVFRYTVTLKTRYCPLSIARCNLLAAIFVMLKILRLLFAARIELFNNGRLAPMKTKRTMGARSIMAKLGL